MYPAQVILTVNGGSSSVKCALFSYSAAPALLTRTVIDHRGAPCVPDLLAWAGAQTARSTIAAVGHRIVHGGPQYTDPQVISSSVRDALMELVPFAPNHLPEEIAIVDALAEHMPGVPQVACFDTAFHRQMPEVARRLPIPASYDERGVRRYGFHGLSYAFLIEELSRAGGADAAR